MNTPLRLFDFPSTEHPAIVVARHLADGLGTGTAITRKSLSDCFVAVTGSSDADNRWWSSPNCSGCGIMAACR